MRQKKLISYPTLNDKGGDLTKDWYVEFYFRLPGNDKPYKRRIAKGLCVGVCERDRRANAQAIIDKVTDDLKNGRHLQDRENYNPVMITEDYRSEVKMYRKNLHELQMRSICEQYMETIYRTLRPATIAKYKGEFNILCDWLELTQHNPICYNVTAPMLQEFLNYLADEQPDGRGLCHGSIKQYRMRLKELWKWLIDNGKYNDPDPTKELKVGGKYVDCATTLFEKDELKQLKAAMIDKDPYLWLAMELMNYSLIRPGEIRQLKIGMIDRDRMTVNIPNYIAKNKKSRPVGLKPETIELMDRLGVFMYDKDLYIFARGHKPGTEMLGVSTMRRRFSDYRNQLGIDESRKLYGMKHTGITSMLDAGAPLQMVMDQARHANITTTMTYAKKRTVNPHAFEKYMPSI